MYFGVSVFIRMGNKDSRVIEMIAGKSRMYRQFSTKNGLSKTF